MGDTGKPTGWYLVRAVCHAMIELRPANNSQPEFAHPYEVLSPHVTIVVASPEGGAAPLDPSSVEVTKEDKVSTAFLKKEHLWKDTVKLSSILGHAGDYEAIFFVGGHGPMWDLAHNETSHKLINEFNSHNKIISAVW